MIFVTIGTQEPFERLIKEMDRIAPMLKDVQFVAQVSKSVYSVKNMKTFEFLSPTEFNSYFKEAKLIVSHAGMGTIISALEFQKPILILPRLARYGEHRNDHQLSTAKRFDLLKYVHVAYHENELEAKVLSIFNGNLKHLHKAGKYASKELLGSLRSVIHN